MLEHLPAFCKEVAVKGATIEGVAVHKTRALTQNQANSGPFSVGFRPLIAVVSKMFCKPQGPLA